MPPVQVKGRAQPVEAFKLRRSKAAPVFAPATPLPIADANERSSQ